MTIFTTERLHVRQLTASDRTHFAELFTDPNVLEPIPQAPFSEAQITARFDHSLRVKLKDLHNQKCAFGIYEDGKSELIGLALFLLNDSNGFELGYRYRAKYWGKGFGTEITKGMLTYYFDVLKAEVVTADVNVANTASVKILEKFMSLESEFFNPRDNCMDRRYELKKEEWLKAENG